MSSSGTCHHRALVRSGGSEEHIASTIRMEGIRDVGTGSNIEKLKHAAKKIVIANVVPSSPIFQISW
jgi:hypothetical protein